jgi:hypothetical protein
VTPVIPGRREAPNLESRSINFEIPGSMLRIAAE